MRSSGRRWEAVTEGGDASKVVGEEKFSQHYILGQIYGGFGERAIFDVVNDGVAISGVRDCGDAPGVCRDDEAGVAEGVEAVGIGVGRADEGAGKSSLEGVDAGEVLLAPGDEMGEEEPDAIGVTGAVAADAPLESTDFPTIQESVLVPEEGKQEIRVVAVILDLGETGRRGRFTLLAEPAQEECALQRQQFPVELGRGE